MKVRMRTLCFRSCAALVLLASCAAAAEQGKSLDLRRAVPADVFMAAHGKHNPERDFQREYYKQVWETVQETEIIERAIKIVTDRVPAEDVEKAKSVLEELREAVAHVDGEAILNCSEVVYAQSFEFPAAEHLILMRLTPEAAADVEQAVKNLFGLAEKYSDGDLAVETVKEGDVVLTVLSLPEQAPFRPAVACIDDVFLVSTSERLARRSLAMLAGGEGESKFDDPRLKEALARLPEPEDNLTFYDGKMQFSKLRDIGAFIRKVEPDNPQSERVAGLIELLVDELAILDYEVTVEFTEENRNCSAAYGKLVPGAHEKLLAKVLAHGQPFEHWDRWVPAGALSYSLAMGANLHPAYEWIMEVVEERIPEAKPTLEKFERLQSEHDVYLDRDILQAFTGEVVSITLPPATPSPLGGQDSFVALRCHKPERIRELLHRLVDRLQEIPAVEAQELKLVECEELEGFEVVSALVLSAFKARPVIGFRDGWMVFGSNAEVVEKVFDTKAGEGQTIAETEAFKQFNLKVEGPVAAISYTNLAENTRQVSALLNQVGFLVPMIIGMAGAKADSEDLEAIQEVLALLPSVAQIVAKFDFLEAQLSVTQAGDEPDSYTRRSAILVRPKSAE